MSRWAWSNRKWCWRTSSSVSCHAPVRHGIHPTVHTCNLWRWTLKVSFCFWLFCSFSQAPPASPTTVRSGWTRIWALSRACCPSGSCWSSTLSSSLCALHTTHFLYCLLTNTLWVKPTVLPFYREAGDSTTADSEAACGAAGFKWKFSSRQGADHQPDLRPPHCGSEQDPRLRLPVQPDCVP